VRDTTPEADARVRELFARRSGSDRVRMACDMFDLARALMVSRVWAEHPDITEGELRVMIFERTYGGDFGPDERARIAARLRG
jgi:hypothetical protein